MNLFFPVTIISVLAVCTGKDITQNDPAFYKQVSETHFGKKDDFDKLHFPEEDISKKYAQHTANSQRQHPYGFNSTNDGSGNYYFESFSPELQRFEVGELKNPGTDNEVQVVRGQYSDKIVFPSGEEAVRTIGYTADENGYRPFLINFVVSRHPSITLASAPPGAPKAKPGISSAAIASLIGGNG